MSEEQKAQYQILIERLTKHGGKLPPKKSRVVNVQYAPNVEAEFCIRAIWSLSDE